MPKDVGAIGDTSDAAWDGSAANPSVVALLKRGMNASAVAASATLSNVASSATTVTLLAANTARRGAMIFNDGSANLMAKFGATASATSFTVKIPAGGYYELPQPVYTGIIDGIWDIASGSARMTEVA